MTKAETRTIQGRLVDSKEEYIFAAALQRLEIPFDYKFQIGPLSLDGGIEVDFLVFLPFAQPVEIVGEYWHRNKENEDIRRIRSMEYFNAEPIEISTEIIPTVEAAVSVIRRELL